MRNVLMNFSIENAKDKYAENIFVRKVKTMGNQKLTPYKGVSLNEKVVTFRGF